jgi:Domain of unknown function (DUF4276)
VLIDADDDCPAQLGPELLSRARTSRGDKRIAVILAKREFEAWYLAAAASLAGQHGFPRDLRPPNNAEAPRDCKGWLTKQRPHGHPYKETVDQASIASTFDLKTARENSPSFDKFYRDVTWLLTGDQRSVGHLRRERANRGFQLILMRWAKPSWRRWSSCPTKARNSANR